MAVVSAPVMSLLTLLIASLAVTHTSAAPTGCCTSYTLGKIPFGVIRGYYLQTKADNCHIFAIIFYTKKGRNVCTNPAQSWVMGYVSRLGNRAHTVHSKAASQAQ